MEFYTDTEIVRQMRRTQGAMSQRAFAQLLGISASYLCDVLQGKRAPGRKIELAMRNLKPTKTVVTVYKKKVK